MPALEVEPPSEARLFDRVAIRSILLSFAISWSIAGAGFLAGGIDSRPRHVLIGFAFMLGPAIAALWITRRWSWAERRERLGLRVRVDRWLAAAWIVPLIVVGLSVVGSALVPGVVLRSPSSGLVATMREMGAQSEIAELEALGTRLLSFLLVLQGTIMGTLINVPLMLSEELGWRGLLWSRWERLGFWRNALATGSVWGLWHAPLILMGHNYPDAPVAGVFLMLVFCVLIAPILHFIRARGGTVWHACLFHGAINATATLSSLCVVSPTWVGNGIVGVPGFVVLALGCATTFLLWRTRAPA